jgi:hypothetical protein
MHDELKKAIEMMKAIGITSLFSDLIVISGYCSACKGIKKPVNLHEGDGSLIGLNKNPVLLFFL